MKRRLLIALLVLAVLATVFMVRHEISRQRATYQGKHVRAWAAELYASHEPRGTNAAAVAFRALGSNAVPALCDLLEMRDPVYEKAFLKYSRHIPTKPRVFLFQKLRPGHTIEYRLGAIRALGVIGPDARAALPNMLLALADADTRIRWFTAQTIALLGPEAVSALIPLLTNHDVNVRHAAVYALGEARTNALPAVPALIRCTMDTNESVRASALYSLGRVGPTAFPVTVKIAATEADPQLRNAAFRSLVAMLPPPGRILNSQLMISTNSVEIRRMAILSLWRSRLTNSEAMTLYQAGLRDEDASVSELTEKILNRLNSTNRNRLGPL